MVLDKRADEKHPVILENIIPLVIEAGNMMDKLNKQQEDMDERNFGENIDNVAIAGYLSPKQVEYIKRKQGTHKIKEGIKMLLQLKIQ